MCENFLIEAGTPGAAQRAQRMMQMHSNLGILKITGLDQVTPEIVEVSVMTANEGPATLKLAIEAGPPPKLKSMQILVGG